MIDVLRFRDDFSCFLLRVERIIIDERNVHNITSLLVHLEFPKSVVVRDVLRYFKTLHQMGFHVLALVVQ